MRILILNADYGAFLSWLYDDTPGLAERSYDEQMRARNASLFGVADFYSHNLRALGHEAWEVHANNEPMQRAWAREHGLPLAHPGRRWEFRMRRGLLPWAARVADRRWVDRVLAAQIEHYRPDVIINQVLDGIAPSFVRRFAAPGRMLVGQVAAPLPDERGIDLYDLILSSLPNFTARFEAMGITSRLHRFAFDERVLDTLSYQEPSVPVSFVGSISRHHSGRTALLRYLAERAPLTLWGKGAETLGAEDEALARAHHGTAWGREMYAVLNRSMITLNHHIEVAGSYANNMRLFEATGVGAMLLTDWKENLAEIFEPGVEAVVYRDERECAELIVYYLAHDDERAAIAHAGRERTLRDHTYLNRMGELIETIEEVRDGGRTGSEVRR